MAEIINRVAASGLVTIDLEEWYPEGPRMAIDLKDRLWQGLALREQEFRDWIEHHDWSHYAGAYVALYCSTDAIIPHWAYMLVASRLNGIAQRVVMGNLPELEQILFSEIIGSLDAEKYRDKRLVIKGCAHKPVPVSAYVEVVNKLQPVARSIMYGEPCSTVPVYKRPSSAK